MVHQHVIGARQMQALLLDASAVIIVLEESAPEILIHGAHLLIYRAGHHHAKERQGFHRIELAHVGQRIPAGSGGHVLDRVIDHRHFGFISDMVRRGTEQAQPGISLEVAQQRQQPATGDHRVIVQHDQVVATGRSQPHIVAGGKPQIGLVEHQLHARLTQGPLLQALHRLVARSVVRHHDLKPARVVRALHQAAQACFGIGPVVIGQHHHADGGKAHALHALMQLLRAMLPGLFLCETLAGALCFASTWLCEAGPNGCNECIMIRRLVHQGAELAHFGQIGADHLLAGAQILIHLHWVGGQGQRNALEGKQTDIKAVQVKRQLLVGALTQHAHVGQRPQGLARTHRVGAYQQHLAVRESLGDFLDKNHIEPLRNRTEVANDRLALRGLVDLRWAVGKMRVVATIAHDAGSYSLVTGPIMEPLRRDRDGIALLHERMLQVHQILGHAAKALMVVHAVIDAHCIGHRQNHRRPVGVLHHGCAGLNAPVLHQQG